MDRIKDDFDGVVLDLLTAACEYSIDEVLAPRAERARFDGQVTVHRDAVAKMVTAEGALHEMLTARYGG